VYGVPVAQTDFFNYIPQLSDDLQSWVGTDQHPEYFTISTSALAAETIFTVQPLVANWLGDASHLFLRLKISPKP
ncbi:MAG TPA: hypothetical protein VFC17_05745, partial [Candidatus Limnocylindrales bacterium]|nr:hypothetical protein [Candidatus Limnocylindrales bacterium]